MPFLDTNSHLTIKPYNLDIKCQSNSESYDQHVFLRTKFRVGQVGPIKLTILINMKV